MQLTGLAVLLDLIVPAFQFLVLRMLRAEQSGLWIVSGLLHPHYALAPVRLDVPRPPHYKALLFINIFEIVLEISDGLDVCSLLGCRSLRCHPLLLNELADDVVPLLVQPVKLVFVLIEV